MSFAKKTRTTVPTTLKLTICLTTKLQWRFFSSLTYTAFSRYVAHHDSLISEEILNAEEMDTSETVLYRPKTIIPHHHHYHHHHHHHVRKTLCFSKIPDTLFSLFNKLLSQRNMCFANIFCLLREWKCCTSLEAKEDGDKRYLGNEVDLQRDDYDVMCLDNIHHVKLLFYISFCFCFWVRSRFCFVFLVMVFVFPFRRFCLSVSGFEFSILLACFFLGFWISISRYWVFVLYYEHQGKLSVFDILWFCFIFVILVFILCFRFGICVSVLGFGFHFWVLWSAFSLSATIYIWPSHLCKSGYQKQLNSVKHLLTIQARKRLNYLGI